MVADNSAGLFILLLRGLKTKIDLFLHRTSVIEQVRAYPDSHLAYSTGLAVVFSSCYSLPVVIWSIRLVFL